MFATVLIALKVIYIICLINISKSTLTSSLLSSLSLLVSMQMGQMPPIVVDHKHHTNYNIAESTRIVTVPITSTTTQSTINISNEYI